MLRAPLSLLTALCLVFAPTLAHAQDPASEGPTVQEQAAVMGSMDSQGRVFPNPDILKNARTQFGVGVGLTVGGAVLLFTGMMVGSAAARGELTLPPSPFPSLIQSDRLEDGFGDGFTFIGITAGVGLGLILAGVPIMSVGNFTTRQMLRTIRGAEKVPRTVANEDRYWKALMTQHMGQALGIVGGAVIAFGIIALVAQGATLDTRFYAPWRWVLGPAILAGGVGVLVLGIELTKKGRSTQDAVWDEVDPRRQKAAVYPGIPVPIVSYRDGNRWAGVGWSLAW